MGSLLSGRPLGGGRTDCASLCRRLLAPTTRRAHSDGALYRKELHCFADVTKRQARRLFSEPLASSLPCLTGLDGFGCGDSGRLALWERHVFATICHRLARILLDTHLGNCWRNDRFPPACSQWVRCGASESCEIRKMLVFRCAPVLDAFSSGQHVQLHVELQRSSHLDVGRLGFGTGNGTRPRPRQLPCWFRSWITQGWLALSRVL